MGLTEARRRDFITQLIGVMKKNTALLTENGFDPLVKIDQLNAELEVVDQTEADKIDAIAAAKNATKVANEALRTAYKTSSKVVDSITGALGKDNNLVVEIKKLRK